MIRKNEAAAGVELAQLLTRSGVSLVAQDNLPLGALRLATEVVTPVSDDDVEATLVNRTKAVMLGGVEEDGSPRMIPSEHGYAKSRLVDAMAAGVKAVISAARTTVIPLIRSSHDAVDKYVAEKTDPLAMMPDLAVYNYDAVWDSQIVDGVVTHYAQVALVGMPIVSLPDLSDEQLTELVSSGSSELRDFVQRLTASQPDLVRAIYQVWFQGAAVSDSDDFSYLSRSLTVTADARALAITGNDPLDVRRSYEPIVLAYLMADNLYNNPVAGSGLGADRYAMVTSAFRAHFAKCMERIYRVRSGNLDRKILVISMPVVDSWRSYALTGERLLINGDVYKWYLEAGGSVEALVGNCYTERSINARTILDAKDRLEAEFARIGSMAKSIAVTNLHTLTIQGILNVVENHVVNEIDIEAWDKMYSKYNYTTTKNDAITDVRHYLSSIQNVSTYEAVDNVLTYIFASMIYGPLETAPFMLAMATYPDQTLSPREIAAHVEIDMVLDNLLNMTYYRGLR
ncbi:hypothetical protein Ea357_166 [Erwinia phage Ea35-70]|uniref:Uncharacterized protein n=1 Tax=Erwinia phage Ea35-70 TaxID=1429768 RepID=W6ARR3_9CAUD|nr:hypothetical protein Ea357_166 [Erwinia phage Ea35-70]AHI60317.1 hypothetical protein Ea357_166 [Erwinia phage Ea35-70]